METYKIITVHTNLIDVAKALNKGGAFADGTVENMLYVTRFILLTNQKLEQEMVERYGRSRDCKRSVRVKANTGNVYCANESFVVCVALHLYQLHGHTFFDNDYVEAIQKLGEVIDRTQSKVESRKQKQKRNSNTVRSYKNEQHQGGTREVSIASSHANNLTKSFIDYVMSLTSGVRGNKPEETTRLLVSLYRSFGDLPSYDVLKGDIESQNLTVEPLELVIDRKGKEVPQRLRLTIASEVDGINNSEIAQINANTLGRLAYAWVLKQQGGI